MEDYLNWISIAVGLGFCNFLLIHLQYQFWTGKYKDPNKKDDFFTALFIFAASFGAILLIWTCINMIALKQGEFVFYVYLLILIFTSALYVLQIRLQKKDNMQKQDNKIKGNSKIKNLIEVVIGVPVVLGGIILFFTSWGQLTK